MAMVKATMKLQAYNKRAMEEKVDNRFLLLLQKAKRNTKDQYTKPHLMMLVNKISHRGYLEGFSFVINCIVYISHHMMELNSLI